MTDVSRDSGTGRIPSYCILLPVLLLLGIVALFLAPVLLTAAGKWLVMDSPLSRGDAVVVLHTGVEYYPRLVEAARLYQKGVSDQIIINGNRKTDSLRKLETMGFAPSCDWHANYLQILSLFKVPEHHIQCISAEDVYDTVSEAEFIGNKLLQQGYTDLIITTSKSHSRRAYHIWNDLFHPKARIRVVSAKEDPFLPEAWWKSGRQIRWVLSEYGAWIYYFWKKITNPQD